MLKDIIAILRGVHADEVVAIGHVLIRCGSKLRKATRIIRAIYVNNIVKIRKSDCICSGTPRHKRSKLRFSRNIQHAQRRIAILPVVWFQSRPILPNLNCFVI